RYNYWRKQNIQLKIANDTTLIAASQEEPVALLNILEQHSAAYGLGINCN
ncbi:unnamed protein product, partial [Callosobruchus maculatus]